MHLWNKLTSMYIVRNNLNLFFYIVWILLLSSAAKKKNDEKMRRAHIAAKRRAEKAPKYTQAECQEKLRQWVEKAPIPPIQKKTLTNISKVFVFLQFHTQI